MASHTQPRIYSFKGGGAIALGQAVKLSADDTVVVCSANTDEAVGIAMSDLSADDATAGVRVEVALPGGGAKAKCDGAVSRGKFLVPSADGELEQTNASGDRVIALAMADGVAGDIIPVEVVARVAVGADE